MTGFRDCAGAGWITCLLCGAFAAQAAGAAPQRLDDAQLDEITAGAGSDSALDLASLEVARTTHSGTTIHAEGRFTLIEAAALMPGAGMLQISGNGQSGLRSLINVNAVNSQVNILLNLNISIDSSIGTLNQLNLQVPSMPRPPGG